MSKVKTYFSIKGREKIFYLLIALVAFVIIDGILTQFLIAGGKAWEANAFLAPMIGTTGFMLLKTFGSLFCALVLWDISTRHRRLAEVAIWIAVIGYGCIVIWNTSLFLLT
jgi:hypothetical protein